MNRIYDNKTNYKIDLTRPPLGPPLRKMKCSFLFGYKETKVSKKNTADWDKYIDNYMKLLKKHGIKKTKNG